MNAWNNHANFEYFYPTNSFNGISGMLEASSNLDFSSVLSGATKKALNGGFAGASAAAGIVQELLFLSLFLLVLLLLL